MAITTDSTYTVSSGGISYDIIGYSKTLNNYTTNEIKAYTYCSSDNTLMKHIQKREQIAYFTMVENTEVAVPWNMSRVSSTNISINAGDPTKENYGQKGVYCGIIWLARTSNGNDMYITSSNWSNYKIVTSFKAKNYCYELSAPSIIANNYGQSGWGGTQQTLTFPVWYSGGGTLYYYINDTGTNKISLSGQRIRPYAMFEHDGKVFFVQFSDNKSISKYDALNTLSESSDPNYYPWIASDGIGSFDGTGYAIAAAALGNHPVSSPFPKSYNKNSLGQYGSSFTHFAADDGICILGQFGGTIHTPPLYDAGSETFVYFNSKESLLDFWKGIGIKFKGDKVYKPIITDGYVSGYSDDLTTPSDLDNYIGDTNHTVPATRPSGGGGQDDDPWHGVNFGGTGAGGGGAFCSVYYMTGAQLASLKNWSNTSAPEGFDMLPSIIGLQQLPVAVSGVATTVKFLKSAAITPSGESRLVDTGVAAGTGTGQPIPFSLGSVDINRRMQQRGEPYMDYDCTVELFLPFAGTFVLDTQAVMGRTISAEIVVDPVNGTAFAYAWVENGGEKMPIAYGGGAIAVDLPIASNQWGISRAAFKQQRANAVINAVKDVGNFIIGAQTHKTGSSGAIVDRSGFATLNIQEGLQARQIGGQMMTSSTINAATNTASSIISATQLNNTNYTAINGSFGGSYAEWSQPFTAYVRITRPKFKKPDNFNHTEAVPCVETKKIKDCTGLTICVNPDCGSISCTEAEKLMIAQALVGGVYAGGGS